MKKVVAAVMAGVVAFFLLGAFVSSAEELKEDEAETPHPSDGQASFSMEVPVTQLLKGDEAYITLKFDGLPDLYAFELRFLYDSEYLRLKEVSSPYDGGSGLAIRQNETAGEVLFAYTSVGKEGAKGGSLLAKLTFAAEKAGEAEVSLAAATLLDSQLGYQTYETPACKAGLTIFPTGGMATSAPNSNSGNGGSGGGSGGGGGNSGGSGGGGGGGGSKRPSGGGAIVISGGGTPSPVPTPFPAATAEPEPLPFTDLGEAAWAQEAVCSLAEKQVLNGYEDGSFRPDGTITRAEFAKLAALAFSLEPGSGSTGFSDVPEDAWYALPVAACVRDGILSGYGDGTFHPEENITREEMAAVIVRAAQFKGLALAPVRLNQNFADEAAISDFAVGYVDLLYQAGAVSGDEENCFRPQAELSRAEAAKVIYEVTKNETDE